MHKNATKCNKQQSKWCINKHGASKLIDMFEMYQSSSESPTELEVSFGRKYDLLRYAIPKISVTHAFMYYIYCTVGNLGI
jgi:hypothetical protein